MKRRARIVPGGRDILFMVRHDRRIRRGGSRNRYFLAWWAQERARRSARGF